MYSLYFHGIIFNVFIDSRLQVFNSRFRHDSIAQIAFTLNLCVIFFAHNHIYYIRDANLFVHSQNHSLIHLITSHLIHQYPSSI